MDETSVIDEEIVNDMFFAHQVSVSLVADTTYHCNYLLPFSFDSS